VRLSYDSLDRESNCLARGLLKLGVKKGDRVAVSLGNNLEYAIVGIGVFDPATQSLLFDKFPR
jgi:TBC1 domain family member 8/9